MHLTTTDKIIFKFCKRSCSTGTWKDLVDFGLGNEYHPDMKLGHVHRIVYNLFTRMLTEPKFEMGFVTAYDVLTAPADSFDYKFRGEDKPFTVVEMLEMQLRKMLVAITLCRCDWIRNQYEGE